MRLEGQNLGPFLVIKYIQIISYQKYVNDKSCSSIFIFVDKKIRQIRLIFEKLFFSSKIWNFFKEHSIWHFVRGKDPVVFSSYVIKSECFHSSEIIKKNHQKKSVRERPLMTSVGFQRFMTYLPTYPFQP